MDREDGTAASVCTITMPPCRKCACSPERWATKVDTPDALRHRSTRRWICHRSTRPNGGWPPGRPKRGNYSGQITFNDNAMIRLMVFVRDIVNKTAPFDTDIADASKLATLRYAARKKPPPISSKRRSAILRRRSGAHSTTPSNYKPVAPAPTSCLKSGSGIRRHRLVPDEYPDQSADVQ